MQNLRLSSLSTWLLPSDRISSSVSSTGHTEDASLIKPDSSGSQTGSSFNTNSSGACISSVSELEHTLQSVITASAWDPGRSLLLAVSQGGLLHGMSYNASGGEQVSPSCATWKQLWHVTRDVVHEG